jgi:predicted O-linked N-acetylglucosamine transferase (SPINDLY family)
MDLTKIKKSEDIAKAKDFFLLGLESLKKGNNEKAKIFFYSSLEHCPNRLSTLINLVVTLINLEKLEEASKIIIDAIKIFPNEASLYLNEGIIAQKKKEWNAAIKSFNKSIEINSKLEVAHYKVGIILEEIGEIQKALESYENCIHINSNFYEAFFRQGLIQTYLKMHQEALSSFTHVIQLEPLHLGAQINLGIVLSKLKQYEKAIDKFDEIIRNNLEIEEAYLNKANVLFEMKMYDDAIKAYGLAISINPNYPDAYFNRGNTLSVLGKYEDAINDYLLAIKYEPQNAESYNNIGKLQIELRDYEQALKNINHALSINEYLFEAYNNRGNLYQELNLTNLAIEDYNQAINLNSNYIEAIYNLGVAYEQLGVWDKALLNYQKVFDIDKEFEYLLGAIVNVKLNICEWSVYEDSINTLINKINTHVKASTCLPVLAFTDDPKIQQTVSKIWLDDKFPNKNLGSPRESKKYDKKIKVGYYSADFGEHPVSYLTVELFELHDKNKFEIYAFYNGPTDSSPMHKRITKSFDQFLNINCISDIDVAKLSREIGIDIAVDLTGLTQNSRIGIFSHRAAPIQISYLGYLGTIACDYYDYIIADQVIIPNSFQEYYSEKIIYLPSYQVNDRKKLISDKEYKRSDFNIPDESFVYCCFNNSFKITPNIFEIWIRILKSVPNSIILLFAQNDCAKTNLLNEANKRGLKNEQIIFLERINRTEYLARFKLADLFLDTFPYNAGTTASDALWADLPLLTCQGRSFSSRIASSILQAIGLPELITSSLVEYEKKAIELGNNPSIVKEIKNKINYSKNKSLLFDTVKFTLSIEKAYIKLKNHFHEGKKPENIYL